MDRTVSVVGLGYIGLPTALLLADAGVSVAGFDLDEEKCAALQDDQLYFEEPGLPELFASVRAKGTFRAGALQAADVYLVAVPTPTHAGKADLRYVLSALESIQPLAKTGDLIIIESTIGPRDCAETLIPTIEAWPAQVHFAHCTERAIPGSTLHEMVHNDRIVGGHGPEATRIATELYARFVRGRIFPTDPTTAAVCKVMENTYRAVNIALANEFAQLAETYEFDIWEAIELTNKHPRVQVHSPGPGVGGHCIPIDPYFFLDGTERSALIQRSLAINESMPQYVASEVRTLIAEHSIEKPVICLLGYAYKKNVDDARETPAAQLAENLASCGPILLSDPHVKRPGIHDTDNALCQANVVVLVTDHDAYRGLDFAKYPNVRLIYDTRNALRHDLPGQRPPLHARQGR
ncbi:MAG: nucleotide sugar dehydrogenase [Planctomycetota bacterium]